MLRNFLYTLLVILLSGCSAFYTPMFVPVDVPDGPPEFQAGWYDGCRTGLGTKKSTASSVYDASFGSGIYQHDPIYERAWGRAFYTCYIVGGRAVEQNIFKNSPAD